MSQAAAPPLPISLCMIVKDEARLISECLERARGLVAQMVVVDTGSSDETPALVEAAGAELYHHPWEGHFSIARNQSLSYARQPWVLILDGDELLSPEAGEALRRLPLGDEAPEAYEFTIVNFSTDRADEREASLQHQVRLFRRHEAHGYAGLIHNQLLQLKEERPLRAERAEVRVLHYGYTPSVWAAQRKDERLSMLEEAALAEPDHAFHHYNLGNHLKILKRYPEALKAFLRALPEAPPLTGSWMPIACCSAAFCAQSAGEPELALELASLALRDDPQLIDAHVRAAEAELKLKRYEQPIARLEAALLDPLRHAIKLTSLHFYAPYRLGRALWLSGRAEEALPLFLSLLPGTRDVTVYTHAALCASMSGERSLAELILSLGRALAPDDPDWAPVSAQLARGQHESSHAPAPAQLLSLPLYARASAQAPTERQPDLWAFSSGISQAEALERFVACWEPQRAQAQLGDALPLGQLPALKALEANKPLPSGLCWLIELDLCSAQLALYVDGDEAWRSYVALPVPLDPTDERGLWGVVVCYELMRWARALMT